MTNRAKTLTTTVAIVTCLLFAPLAAQAQQAEKDLSIPDQRRQAEDYCARKGWDVVADYVEPGASATDEKRSAFQRMIDDAASPASPYDVVIVHSFSWFFRDAYKFEFYRRKLARNGVEIISITQELGDDPMADMVRQILNVFDEYQSKENAKHVLRAMKENARQGFWNGSHPPYRYEAVPVEIRADVTKKKLGIKPDEADIVRRIFAFYQESKGVRAIAATLNEQGLRYRKGQMFNSSLVHQILTRTAYKGVQHFNKTTYKTRKPKDPSEWVAFETPVIIDPDTFDAVQSMLASRRPTNTPPRVVNGPTLLTGIAKCGTCGGGMTLRTGKSGKYRYYTCNARATQGKTACAGRNIPTAKLDDLIVGHLSEKLFREDRIAVIMDEIIRRNAARADDQRDQEKLISKELGTTDEKLDRLYDPLANGTVGDTDGFKRSMAKLEQRREELIRQQSAGTRRRNLKTNLLTPENIQRFTEAARTKMQDADSTFRKQYLKLFVDRVEVRDNEIRISGPKSAFANAITQNKKSDTELVPSFVTDWWAHTDSNRGPAD